jgi:hypothetical protein
MHGRRPYHVRRFFFEQGIPLTAPSLVIDRSWKASRMSGMPSAALSPTHAKYLPPKGGKLIFRLKAVKGMTRLSLRHARESISPSDHSVLLTSLSYEVLYKSIIRGTRSASRFTIPAPFSKTGLRRHSQCRHFFISPSNLARVPELHWKKAVRLQQILKAPT